MYTAGMCFVSIFLCFTVADLHTPKLRGTRKAKYEETKKKNKPTTRKDRTVLRARRLPARRRSRDDGRPSMISVPTILIRYLN